MKSNLILFLLLLKTALFAYSPADSINIFLPQKKTWQFHGNIQLNNNGISPVPAFSLGKPSIMNTFFISKGNFSYSPELNYGSDGLPWTVNNWIRYRKDISKFRIGMGGALSMFFGREKRKVGLGEKTFAVMNQYAPIEIFTGYKFSPKSSLSLTYWKAHGLDYGSVKNGHFVMLSGGFTNINLSKYINFDFRPNLFYINNSIPYEGFFSSVIIGLNIKKISIHPFTQLVQPLWMGKGKADFNWNYGLNYTF